MRFVISLLAACLLLAAAELPKTASLDEVIARSTRSETPSRERGYDIDQYHALDRLIDWPTVSKEDEARIVAAFTTALNADNSNIRNVGARGLGRWSRDESVEMIIELGRTQPNLIDCFFSSYTRHGEVDPPVELLRRGLQFEAVDARREILRAIASCKATSMRMDVEIVLNSDAPSAVRDEAARTLYRLKMPESAPALRRAFDAGLKTDGVVYGLTQLGNDGDIVAVLPLLKSKNAYLRQTVAAGLCTAQVVDPKPVCDALLDTLGDSSHDVRMAAIKALGHFRESRAIPPIRDLIMHPARPLNWHDKHPCVEAIAAIGGADALRLLEDMVPEFRKHFGLERALVGFGSASSARAIWAVYLTDPIRPGQECLLTIGYDEALPVLAACADGNLLQEIKARLGGTQNPHSEGASLTKLADDIQVRLDQKTSAQPSLNP